MKPKTVLTLLLVFVAITVSAQNNSFKIVGRIDNITDGGVVNLFTVEGHIGRFFRSDTIRDGSFSFEGNVDSLQMLRLIVFDEKFPETTFPLWIMPGAEILITGDNYYPSAWDVKSNVKEQQEEEIYRKALKRVASRYDSLDLAYRQLKRKVDQAKNAEQKQKLEDEIQAVQKELITVNFSYQREGLDVMALQPVTESWIDRLALYAGTAVAFAGYTSYPEENMKQLQDLYNRLSDKQKQSPKGELIYRYIFPMQIIQEGQPMADAELYDPRGNPCKIDKDFRGKYLLLDFWGVGCAPCIAAFPEMKEIHEAHGDKLTIISITTDTEKVWKEGLERHQFPWVNLTDYLGMEGYASLYGVRGIPFYVLISPDGIVEKMWAGYREGSLKEKLKNILQ